nr:reverse transcriptase domain-containing protein [Limnospira indica]
METIYPKKKKVVQATVVRYADDFVVISPSLDIIEQCKTAISEWLKPVGLEIKPEKTRVCPQYRTKKLKVLAKRESSRKF